MKRSLRRLCVAAGLAVAVGGCATSTDSVSRSSFSVEQFESLDAVEGEADISIVGQVGGDQETVLDNGGNEEIEPGSQMEQLVSRVDVKEYLKGDGPQQVLVVQPDTFADESTPLQSGDEVVLMLSRESLESAPSVFEQIGPHWSPVGLDQGVGDVDGNSVVPRASNLSSAELADLRNG